MSGSLSGERRGEPGPQTRLLREAQDRGCRTLDGLGMLVAQAAVNMELWTGVVADRPVMRRALEDALRL